MKAHSSSQQALLQMQSCDMALAKLTYQARNLPIHSEIQAQVKRRDELTRIAASLQTRQVALGSDVDRIERDLTKAKARQSTQSQRLEAGQGDLRELRTMQEEIVQLETRIQNLEEELLGAESELESVEEQLQQNSQDAAESDSLVVDLKAQRDSQVEELRTRANPLQVRRAEAMKLAGTELTAEYDAIRKQTGGLAVVEIRDGHVVNHNLQLTPLEREKVRLAASDDVLVLEDSGLIAVRTSS